MKSLSEIETTSKRASRGVGFSWGIAEEVGKCIRLLELFGLPGIKNLNEYYQKKDKENFDRKKNHKKFWFISKNKEEPRYADRFNENGSELEQPLAIARDIKELHDELITCKDSLTIDKFLAKNSDLRHVIRRAFIIEKFPYSEIQDNTIGKNVVPIDMLRLKLSFFGALKFDPRSDKWLRICMFQGAPLPHDLKNYNSQWVYNS